MRLDAQAVLELLGDLKVHGYAGTQGELAAALNGRAVQSQLRRMHSRLQDFYGVAFRAARPLFQDCFAFVGSRFSSVHGEGPASCDPYITVSRKLADSKANDASVRIVWIDMRLVENREGLTVEISFYGKGDKHLRERRFVYSREDVKPSAARSS